MEPDFEVQVADLNECKTTVVIQELQNAEAFKTNNYGFSLRNAKSRITARLPTWSCCSTRSKKWETLALAYQTLGVVYGDLGTSPLYVYPTMNLKAPNEQDYLGIFSLIFWTLTTIGLLKYVFIVLHADDHGEGGTFALYSLLCQHVKTTTDGHKYSRLDSDSKLSYFSKKRKGEHTKTARFLENNKSAQNLLLFVAMLGTCMLIGDGILTPAVSVLSAMDGISTSTSSISKATVVWLSALTLLALFMLQRFGTKRVSRVFSPIMAMWLVTTPIIGIYNILTHYPGVFKAVSPHHIISFFSRNGKDGWLSLGGTVLCITGGEAMFADLGHFTRPSIQLAFTTMVYPSVILTYAGQTAYLAKNPGDHAQAFYKFIPAPIYWPMFILSTLGAIVASQGLISASFSIIKQSIALDYFPRVKMVHTSPDKEGQVYSPAVNYGLMVLCLAVVFGFQGGPEIGNAFGVAVIWVMLITSILLTLVMLVIWRTPPLFAFLFFLFYGAIEGVYLSAVLIKLREGGWLPFGVAILLAMIMFSWHYGRQKKCEYEMRNKISMDNLNDVLCHAASQRVPGLCFFYTDLINGVPPIVRHYVNNVRSLHQIIVFTTIRYVPVKTVLPNERFLVGQLGSKGVYRCVVQYGYKDVLEEEEFVNKVTGMISKLICSDGNESPWIAAWELQSNTSCTEDLAELEIAKKAGAVHVLGKTNFQISSKAGWLKKLVLDRIYGFLHNNSQPAVTALRISPPNLIEIGMSYEIL